MSPPWCVSHPSELNRTCLCPTGSSPPGTYTIRQDQAVTFLLVNGACSLSDRYGRKPFMAIANVGLGTGQVIASFAKHPRFLLLGPAIDGTQPQ